MRFFLNVALHVNNNKKVKQKGKKKIHTLLDLLLRGAKLEITVATCTQSGWQFGWIALFVDVIVTGARALARRVRSESVVAGSGGATVSGDSVRQQIVARRSRIHRVLIDRSHAVLYRREPRSHVVRVVSFDNEFGILRFQHEGVLVIGHLQSRGLPRLGYRRAENPVSRLHSFRWRIEFQHVTAYGLYQCESRFLPFLRSVDVLAHQRIDDALLAAFHNDFRQFCLGVLVAPVLAVRQFHLVALLLVEEALALLEALEREPSEERLVHRLRRHRLAVLLRIVAELLVRRRSHRHPVVLARRVRIFTVVR